MTHRHAHVPPDSQDGEKDNFFVRFAREYGWRAYAIPVLAVITAFVVINVFQNPGDQLVQASDSASRSASEEASKSEPGTSSSSQSEGADEGREPAALPEGTFGNEDLPPGGPFTEAGEGTYSQVGTPGAKAGRGEETVLRYTVEVENGVDSAPYGGNDAFASLVDATLTDPRGWTNDPRFGFEHVAGDANPDLHIQLTSVNTARDRCGGDLVLEVSCRTTITGESTVVLNEARWVRGASPFQGDLGRYRQYLINHEVGHALGFAEHESCPADGDLAPVMMQQTLGLNNAELHRLDSSEIYPDSPETCLANPWPYPRPAVL